MKLSPKQRDYAKVGVFVGSNLLWALALRAAVKTTYYVICEYAQLYRFQEILVRKINEQAPDILDDTEVEDFRVDVVFKEMTNIIKSEN